MPWYRRSACALLAALSAMTAAQAADSTPTPTPTPVPNKADLSALKGIYRGSSKVSVDSGASHSGRSRVRINIPETTAATVRIAGSVEGGARKISVGNTLVFTSDGVLHGSHLAPGVIAGGGFKGLFTASRRRITFSGSYQFREVQGRFEGVLTVSKEGRFSLKYSIFPGDGMIAAYIYQYRGKFLR